MTKYLTKTEILLEKFEQCLVYAKEYPHEEIADLIAIETFFENEDGMEISTEADFFEVTDAMAEKIRELSRFIKQNIDPKKCHPDGIPDLAV